MKIVEVHQMLETRMRVMVYGSKAIIQRFVDSLAGEEMEVTGSSDKLQAIALLKQQKFDLVVVHSLMSEHGEAWRFVSQFPNIPVMLIVEEEANWERLEQLEVDGYISESASPPILALLLRAVVRNRSTWRQSKQFIQPHPSLKQ
jgi:DNA-binding NarL/FixJ family response regulator